MDCTKIHSVEVDKVCYTVAANSKAICAFYMTTGLTYDTGIIQSK